MKTEETMHARPAGEESIPHGTWVSSSSSATHKITRCSTMVGQSWSGLYQITADAWIYNRESYMDPLRVVLWGTSWTYLRDMSLLTRAPSNVVYGFSATWSTRNACPGINVEGPRGGWPNNKIHHNSAPVIQGSALIEAKTSPVEVKSIFVHLIWGRFPECWNIHHSANMLRRAVKQLVTSGTHQEICKPYPSSGSKQINYGPAV